METLISKDLSLAWTLLTKGEIIAVPTETVYGLAADFRNPKAVKEIYRVKNRPEYDPLILHCSSIEMIKENLVIEFPEIAIKLADAFWPGPLTMILPKRKTVLDIVTSGLNTVGVRIPAHALLQNLISELNFPLAAPSANPFGYISPTSPQHVKAQLNGKIPMILDGGNCKVGLESTIVEIKGDSLKILRSGAISIEDLQKFDVNISFNSVSSSRPSAPGMLESHYSPKKSLYFIDDPLVKSFEGTKAGIICFSTYSEVFPSENQILLSPEGKLDIAARNLYSALREMDESNFEVIITERFPNHGIGHAINDRLNRAVTRK